MFLHMFHWFSIKARVIIKKLFSLGKLANVFIVCRHGIYYWREWSAPVQLVCGIGETLESWLESFAKSSELVVLETMFTK